MFHKVDEKHEFILSKINGLNLKSSSNLNDLHQLLTTYKDVCSLFSKTILDFPTYKIILNSDQKSGG